MPYSSDKTLSARPLGEPISRSEDGDAYARKVDALTGASQPFKPAESVASPKPESPGYKGGFTPKCRGI